MNTPVDVFSSLSATWPHTESMILWMSSRTASYDICSVEAKQFDDDFFNFRAVVQDLERRIASVIIQVHYLRGSVVC